MPIPTTQKGFTLVEIMVVTSIIAILVAIAIPQYFGYIKNTKANACISNSNVAINFIKNEISRTIGIPNKNLNIIEALNNGNTFNPLNSGQQAYIGSPPQQTCQIFIQGLTAKFSLPQIGKDVNIHGYIKDLSKPNGIKPEITTIKIE